MKKFAIIGALRPPRTDVVAIICGTLCSVAAALPAQSADLYPYPYEQTAWPSYSGYYHGGCSSCGCSSCGCRPCCNQCGHRPLIQPGPVVERHWDYWERRYPAPYPYRYPSYYPSSYAGYPYSSYPSNYGGYSYNPYPNDYPAYSSAPRPHLGFGGVQYPPAPISYEYQAPPSPYEDQAAARPGYDYEPTPRPPAGIPGGYFNASYGE